MEVEIADRVVEEDVRGASDAQRRLRRAEVSGNVEVEVLAADVAEIGEVLIAFRGFARISVEVFRREMHVAVARDRVDGHVRRFARLRFGGDVDVRFGRNGRPVGRVDADRAVGAADRARAAAQRHRVAGDEAARRAVRGDAVARSEAHVARRGDDSADVEAVVAFGRGLKEDVVGGLDGNGARRADRHRLLELHRDDAVRHREVAHVGLREVLEDFEAVGAVGRERTRDAAAERADRAVRRVDRHVGGDDVRRARVGRRRAVHDRIGDRVKEVVLGPGRPPLGRLDLVEIDSSAAIFATASSAEAQPSYFAASAV